MATLPLSPQCHHQHYAGIFALFAMVPAQLQCHSRHVVVLDVVIMLVVIVRGLVVVPDIVVVLCISRLMLVAVLSPAFAFASPNKLAAMLAPSLSYVAASSFAMSLCTASLSPATPVTMPGQSPGECHRICGSLCSHSHLCYLCPLVDQGLIHNTLLELARACPCNDFLCNPLAGHGDADRSLVMVYLGGGFVVIGVGSNR